MALSPIFRDFCDELDHFHSHFFDDFPFDFPNHQWWRHPFWSHRCCSDSAVKQNKERNCCPRVSIDKDGFAMSMNVQQFQPEEITVKTLDNTVLIEGQHKERTDKHGCLARRFVRRYTLPRGYDPEQVMSTLSKDGILTVKAPPPDVIPEISERIVPIEQITEIGNGQKRIK